MSNTAQASITTTAPVAKVWDALINPSIIKQYMFGTNAVSDWKKGSSVVYRGEWEGKPYEDKGVIVEIEPEKRIVMDYYSSFSADTAAADNHRLIAYALESNENTTTLTVTQDNNPSAEAAAESTQNWEYILGEMKKILEQ